ncbi:Flp family type IVb pilin [Citricoccus sp. GCM10030269]|uniref:Flp family type IVb pilin n=1 Tax=Citricoccus sp. GCM10030269 TaxID=3273388 RepID=UPI0036121CDF
MQTILNLIASRLRRDEEGASAVEYGLLVGLIAVIIIGAVVTLGGLLNTKFGEINTELGAGSTSGSVIIQ